MPFGVVSGVSRGMGVSDGRGDRRREAAVLVVHVGHPIVTNGEFVAYRVVISQVSDAAFPELLWGGLLFWYVCVCVCVEVLASQRRQCL